MNDAQMAHAKSLVQYAAVHSLETEEVMLLGHAILRIEELSKKIEEYNVIGALGWIRATRDDLEGLLREMPVGVEEINFRAAVRPDGAWGVTAERRELALLRQHFQLWERETTHDDEGQRDAAFNAREEVDQLLRDHYDAEGRAKKEGAKP